MAPALVQSAKFDGAFASGGIAATTYGSALTSGNFLVAFASISANTTVTFSDGVNTWSTVTSRYRAGVGYVVAIGWAQNTSSSALTVTATYGTAGLFRTMVVSEFSGVAASSPVDVFTTGADTNSTTPTDVSMTTTAADALCVAFYGGDALPTGAGSPATLLQLNSSSQTAAGYYVKPTAGAVAMSFTQGSTASAVIVSAAFKAAAGGGSDNRTATGALTVGLGTAGTDAKAGASAGAIGFGVVTNGTAAKGITATGALGLTTATGGTAAKAGTAAGALPLAVGTDGTASALGSGTATGSLGFSLSLAGVAAKGVTAAGALGLTFTMAGSASVTGGDDRTATGALSLTLSAAGIAAKASTAGGALAFALATSGTAAKAAQSSGSLGLVLSMAGSTIGTGPYPDIRQPAATIRQRASAATIRDNQWKAELT